MFKILSKNNTKITVEMDLETYEEINKDIKEDINLYEFVFDTPTEANKLIFK